MRMRKLVLAAMMPALMVLPAVADEGTRWLNVHVTEPETATNVELHVPINLVISVLRGIDVENFHAGKVDLDLEIDDADIDWREILSAVMDAPDGEFVRAKTEDANVEISKKNGMMLIHVEEKGGDNAKVKVTLPTAMIDALRVDEANQIDVAAFLESVVDLPDGDLVRVDSDEAQVRIWIDAP